ncbi:uncharacterized protein LOC143150411 isoform X3 [Ptiloglossa arizonensis]|uniref:uncharacterized protein LOC143150411 isoform X3 n=1 Tax=Ptiloglossa arizonensis TaxID=3350558 RepID=UPI003F9F96C6
MTLTDQFKWNFTNYGQTFFMDDNGDADQSRGSKTLLSFLSLNRFKKKHGVPVTLELLEDGAWSKGTNKYARLNSRNNASTSSGLDTPLQILDARTLMKQQACVSSTPGSSLDLEWEHEGMPLPVMDNENVESNDGSITQTSVNNSQPSSLTASPWSRVSTPNSLEWDPVEADMDCLYFCIIKKGYTTELREYEILLEDKEKILLFQYLYC